MQNGILLMGGASIFLLFYTGGSISSLVVMYSINVFLTFSISEIGMSTYFISNRKREIHWKKHLPVHMTGFILCFTILIVTSYEKFREGGWMTLLITLAFVTLCYLIRNHYNNVKKAVRKLDDLLMDIPTSRKANLEKPNPQEMTAIQLVSDYNGFGVHTVLSVIRNFPNLYKNFIFASVAVVDSGSFKGSRGDEEPGGGVERRPCKNTSTWPATWASPPTIASPWAPTWWRPPPSCARTSRTNSTAPPCSPAS